MDNINLGTELRNLRKSLSLSQEEFAQSLGLQQGSYSDIERGRRINPSTAIQELLRVKYGLDISIPVNERIHAFRKSLGHTQEEMADLLGIQQGSYSDIERGKVANISGSILILLTRMGFYKKHVKPAEPHLEAIVPQPDLQLIPIIQKTGTCSFDTPSVAINLTKGRIYFNGKASRMMGISQHSWVAFYQDKNDPSAWYVATEKIEGAMLISHSTEGMAVFGHNTKIAKLITDTMGYQGQSMTFYIEKSHAKFYRIGPALKKGAEL